jgi:phospholipase/carboxylesterase
MERSPYSINVGNLPMKIHIPKGEGPHPVLFLLHGWTGDEKVMWIFASRLPKNYVMIAPRGLYSSPLGGFGWHEHRKDEWPTLEEFSPAIDKLTKLMSTDEGSQQSFVEALEDVPGGVDAIRQVDFSKVSLVGFSQGAALSYSIALTNSERVDLVAGLAGFMPDQVEELVNKRPLEGKRIFITHGTEDNLVPVEKARQAVKLLQQAGSEVTYCEEKVGHKLSATCFNAMEAFFARHAQTNGSGSLAE